MLSLMLSQLPTLHLRQDEMRQDEMSMCDEKILVVVYFNQQSIQKPQHLVPKHLIHLNYQHKNIPEFLPVKPF